MMKTLCSTLLVLGIMVSGSAEAKYTVGRPIDNALGTTLDHTYTTEEDWSCVEMFGGSCDCAGQSACYYYQHAAGGSKCYQSFFSSNWTYLIQGVCHQATNNNAYSMGGPSPGYMGSQIRGMGTSVATFGYWGTKPCK